jgi:hypothetical protein
MNYNLLHHFLLSNTINPAQRQANASVCYGADNNTNTGLDLVQATTGTFYYNFSIPLVSILGVNTKDKLFPVGLINNLQLILQTASTIPIATYATAITTQGAFSYLLDTFSLSLKYVDIGKMAGEMLHQNIEGGLLVLKTTTYVNANSVISNGSSGNQSLLVQIRNSSIKSMWAMIGTTGNYSLSPNGLYDSINPNLNYVVFNFNGSGLKYPNRPMNPQQRTAECFTYLMLSLGSSIASTYGGVVSRQNYNCLHTPVSAGSDQSSLVCLSGQRSSPTGEDMGNQNIVKNPNSFFLGMDLERIAGSLFSGVNSRTAPPSLDINMTQAVGYSYQLTTFGLIDTVLAFDVESKSVVAYN